MRHQLQGTSIRLSEVAPPMVATDLGSDRRERERLPWRVSAEDAADGIVKALSRDSFEVAPGSAVRLRSTRDALSEDMN
jgi:short-subunit dehydrogenase involved in D-alanine esterification of teichoic acids